jgi:hypothetical protein
VKILKDPSTTNNESSRTICMNFGTLNRATIPDMSAQIQYPGRVSRVNPSGQALLFRHGNRFDAAFQRAAWKPLRADGKRNVRKDVKLELEFEVARIHRFASHELVLVFGHLAVQRDFGNCSFDHFRTDNIYTEHHGIELYSKQSSQSCLDFLHVSSLCSSSAAPENRVCR